MPSTWAAYGVDGNDDGKRDPWNPEDAIPAAARYLKASGSDRDLHGAILAYNHSESYVQDVLARARTYARGNFTVLDGTRGQRRACHRLGLRGRSGTRWPAAAR